MRSCFTARRGGALLLSAAFLFLLSVAVSGLGASSASAAEQAAAESGKAAVAEVKGAPGGEEAGTAAPAEAPEASANKPAPMLTKADYPTIAGVNGRIMVWMAAQLHLWFAAFVLAVPIFVFIIEAIGMKTRDKRYDDMAYEFIKVSITAYSLTAILGGLTAFSLILFYPAVFAYLANIFKETMFYYALLFFAESACLYIYYYGWHWLQGGNKKWIHLTLGLLLNVVGTVLMFLANAWITFTMSPVPAHGVEGQIVDAVGTFGGDAWLAIHNYLWNPVNLHRVVANVAYGGSVVGAYAAYNFLSARTAEAKAHYDWMGYTANFIAVSALLPLPFAGYYLVAEIYAYSQQMGITLMGGIFAWLFIIQAVLIGTLFLSANYYLWCGMGRSDGAVRYNKYMKYLAIAIVGAFLVWFTPHTLVLTNEELKALGGPYHKYLGPLGIMPAKNTAVNIMILVTAMSFIIYRRANMIPVVSWVKAGNAAQFALFSAGIINIVILGVYHGYFTDTVTKVAASVPQVLTTLTLIAVSSIMDSFMYKGAKEVAPQRWGRVSNRSQYAMFMLAVAFTWLMGLMGYIRSGIRQHWHVVNIFRDNSENAFTPSLGYATNVISVATIIFMSMVIFVFWLSKLSVKKTVPTGYWKE
ncbi:MAG: hypothetical protein A3G18_00255 [Rhodospirillales bacterium RIFCSPLOWO2_12_FULL_58_28]|nr:MAG: hypothetical protein A3H92_02865 [Rhodospirillales bacterium RIFCSPLOWO2_02_FULL_58_16]OHC79900.1 MAG: hypothetical protein A3G18_00255 [Rhodospirillales bacterium RIFCSPLOWO2_12_FULL_58_28]